MHEDAPLTVALALQCARHTRHRRTEAQMNKIKRQDRWQQLRGAARSRWNRLTEQDVDAVHGNIERLIDALRSRYGYGREVAVREITSWSRALRTSPQA